ncbi:hypothetical protein CONLIGDRAFT_635154 [Coniochaeta ligniaria NRRL 30616]|uniref:Uncharacterized protein n=1 Tax=Coniochaeta ligniaria NRRL 30616 TaxID=1408157 RepID=A0A1J7JAZ2_9PEZI|nr:hypothetical protein CONLIGDRAFT_635154 [Coniochaeta ligniaria NRRL 30616]
MAGVPLYDTSILTLIHGTTSLRDILKKASDHPDSSTFPQVRLIDDMQPLTFQIRVASNMAEKAVKYLAGVDLELSEGKEQTMADMIARCETTIKLLSSVDPKAVNGKESETLTVYLGGSPPKPFEMSGKEFVFGHVLPNFFFHITTAYAILRMKGVPLGKMDYLTPFMTLPAKD